MRSRPGISFSQANGWRLRGRVCVAWRGIHSEAIRPSSRGHVVRRKTNCEMKWPLQRQKRVRIPAAGCEAQAQYCRGFSWSSFFRSAPTWGCTQPAYSLRWASRCPTRSSSLRRLIVPSTASRAATSRRGSRPIDPCSTPWWAAPWALSCALWAPRRPGTGYRHSGPTGIPSRSSRWRCRPPGRAGECARCRCGVQVISCVLYCRARRQVPPLRTYSAYQVEFDWQFGGESLDCLND